jgi:hypothetical protein
MAIDRPARQSAGMRLTSDPGVRTRPPDNELYDRGCDLVEAALAIRRLAGREDAERALAAVLGCMESALEDLRGAVAEAGRTGSSDAHASLAHRGFANLELALADAETAARAARGLARRVVRTDDL